MNEKNLKHYTYESNRGNLAYYTNDITNDKETILMLHPAFGDHYIFIKQIEAFHDGYNLILIDLPGHGKSVHKGSSLNMGMVPKLMKCILLQLNIAQVHLIGISLSSLIVQGFADQYPKMVKTVTTVGGYSIHSDNKEVKKAQRKEMMKWMFYIIISMKKFRKYIVNATSISLDGREMMKRGTENFKRRNFKYMQGIDQIFNRTDSVKQYPLLSLVGDKDQKISIESAIKLGKIANGQYAMISNSGHCANIDNPQEFNEVFLAHILRLYKMEKTT